MSKLPDNPTTEGLVQAIVEIAKETISRAGCRTIDFYARTYVTLLEGLGYEAEAEEVYTHYNPDWPEEKAAMEEGAP